MTRATAGGEMDWEERYATYGRPFGEQPNAFVQRVMDEDAFSGVLGNGSRILCPGDGYGRHGIALAQRGHRVVGLDISPTATRDARDRALGASVEYTARTADLERDPYPLLSGEVFDVVVPVWFRLPHRGARVCWNREAVRHLRSRGWILLVTGRRVTSADEETEEWPGGITWKDHSTADEVRLLGQLLD
ncbi:MAG: class I SAM-dependent methyltransferase [Brachybacterium tyrofermentans]